MDKIDKVLEVFYEHPEKRFTVRKIAEMTGIPRSTAQSYISELRKQNLITKKNTAQNTLLFKTKKINYFIERIVSSELIDKLISELKPSCIILFGSFRKGDSVKESDIDIFIESPIKNEPDLRKYEKTLGHGIQLFIETDIKNLQLRLFNNVVNGIKLYGAFKIK
ncbi:MAG: nucleotidyltransferase domain-containing protein [Nanoarchaeota archaeon]|nr:nucleotidyltransferase domain-containing protein [Nanoarchaeota archaeon]MBU1135812.1 nucleotidyltransferase domain-containing protein [Nanoarchaeota archaeon]MBU2520215.1 nucleotidyltransferase domain-containing protein [Nanoarchaeota archaeon]